MYSLLLLQFLSVLAFCQGMTMKQLKNTGKMMRKSCQPKNNAADEKIDPLNDGIFIDEKEVKCYVACIMKMANTMKNGKPNYEAAIKQADLLLPDEIKEPAKVAIGACRSVPNAYKDTCEAAFQARTPAEIRRWLMYNAFDCSQEYPIDAAEIRALLEHKPPTTKAGKCFIACVFKKLKWMNEKGEFDVDKHYAFVDEEAADNPAFKETGRKLTATCKIVNDEPVSDGTSGCDRAANLAKCFIENSAKLGINLEI